MGGVKLLDILKLNISGILQLIGLYLSFLFVVALKKVTISGPDFLTIKGIEYIGLTIVVYFIIYILILALLQLAIINFADWAAKKKLADYTYDEVQEKFENFGKLAVKITKMNEVAIGTHMGQSLVFTYNYAIYITLVALHLSILLNKTWCWSAFGVIFLFVLLLHCLIFFFKHINTLKSETLVPRNQP